MMKRSFFLIFFVFFALPTSGQDNPVRVFKYSLQITEGGYTYTMAPGKQSQKIKFKWPGRAKSVPLTIEWLASARRLDVKTYFNTHAINLKGEVELRQITHQDINCDTYKGTFQIEKTGTKDFTLQIDLIKINSTIVVRSFVIQFIVPKPMSYNLRKSIREIFNFHRTGEKARVIFEKSRALRKKTLESLRQSLSEAQMQIARLNRDKKRLRRLLEGKYGDTIKVLKEEKRQRELEIERLSKLLKQKLNLNIELRGELERLKLLNRDRIPPEIEVIYPSEKRAGKYVAHKPEILFRGIAKDNTGIVWIKVNNKSVSFKKVVVEDGKKVGGKFAVKMVLAPNKDNPVEISVQDSAGNIRTESYVIIREIPTIREYLCNRCRYRIAKDTKFCPNCGYPETEPMAKNIVERRFLCKGCDLSANLHHHIRIVRRKKEDTDKTPPQITLTFPKANIFVSKKGLTLRGNVRDNMKIDQVLIGGKAAKLLGKNPISADFTAKISLPLEGKNLIKIVATDSSGNKTTKMISVFLDLTKPVIKVVEPSWTYVFASPLTVKGVVREKNLSQLRINKQVVKVDNKGAFQVKLPVGKKTKKLLLVALDRAGNRTVWEKKLIFKSRPKGDDQFESNDSKREAFPLRPGLYKRLICRNADWFKIKITEPSILRVKVYFVHRKGDIDLKLYKSSGQLLAQSTGSIGNEMLEAELPVGECFVKVYTYQKNKKKVNNYDLFIKLISIKNPLPGLSYIGKNSFGFHEYLHKASQSPMVLIPAVKFWMGSPNTEAERDSDEGPRHAVYVDSYLIGKYELTQKIWRTVMKNNPSSNTRSDNLPVEKVSWKNAVAFCKKIKATLPTEAQWERACRAEFRPSTSTSSRFFWGNQMNRKHCWYQNNAYAQTQEVGKTLPNNFGIYDMLGNVREWCQSWYGTYPSKFVRNSPGPDKGTRKVNRGGAAGSPAQNCRSATRYASSPNRSSFMIGFRISLPIPD